LKDTISVKSLNKKYRRADFWAVKGLDMTIKEGEVCALLGHNGAGKTTTLKCIVNHLIPQEGEILIMGIPNDEERIKRFIGYLPEEPFLPDYYTVSEVFSIGASIWKIERKRIEELLSFFELKRYRKTLVNNLSKGNLKKLAIAFTTLHNPKIFIWDEPTSGLDPVMRKKVMDFIKTKRENGESFLISSHILTEVELLCDRFFIIRDGALVEEGEMENLKDKGISLESLYISSYENGKHSIP
jgi:ABC-type multidrug transport system ATPase subunit